MNNYLFFVFVCLFCQCECLWNQQFGDYRSSRSFEYENKDKTAWIKEMNISQSGMNELLPQIIENRGYIGFLGYHQYPYQMKWFLFDIEKSSVVQYMNITDRYNIEYFLIQSSETELLGTSFGDQQLNSWVFNIKNNKDFGSFEYDFQDLTYNMFLFAEDNSDSIVIVGTYENGLNNKIFGINRKTSDLAWELNIVMETQNEFMQIPCVLDSDNFFYAFNFSDSSSEEEFPSSVTPQLLKIDAISGDVKLSTVFPLDVSGEYEVSFDKPVFSRSYNTLLLRQNDQLNQYTFLIDTKTLDIKNKVDNTKYFTCGQPVLDLSESIACFTCTVNTDQTVIAFVDMESGKFLQEVTVNGTAAADKSVLPSPITKGKFYTKIVTSSGWEIFVWENQKIVKKVSSSSNEGLALIDKSECIYSAYSGEQPTYYWRIEKLCM